MNRNRLCSYLRRDLIEFGQEVNDEVDGYIAPSVIKDLLDQLSNLSKRFLEIKLMSDIEPDIAPIPYIEKIQYKDQLGPLASQLDSSHTRSR